MNALLNYNSNILPTLGSSFGAYQNFMTPSFGGSSLGFDSTALSSALSSVPMGGYTPYGNVFGSPSQNSNLKNLLEEGIISEEEYRTQLRRMNGFYSKEEMAEAEKASKNSVGSLHGEELKEARHSNTGDYAVTEEHSTVAAKYMDVAKEILKKEPELMTEKEIETVEKIFNQVSKNPMLAEAFVKQANETTFAGKTTTLLGTYEQVLTKHHGQKAAKEVVSEIKENLKQNVEGRNSKLWSEFEEKADKDSHNVDYTTIDKAMNNPGKVVGFGALGVAGLVGTRAITKKLAPKAFPAINKAIWKTGKWGVIAGATAAAGYGIYKLCTSETN